MTMSAAKTANAELLPRLTLPYRMSVPRAPKTTVAEIRAEAAKAARVVVVCVGARP